MLLKTRIFLEKLHQAYYLCIIPGRFPPIFYLIIKLRKIRKVL